MYSGGPGFDLWGGGVDFVNEGGGGVVAAFK